MVRVTTDWIVDGRSEGDAADRLIANNYDVRALRPFREGNRSFVTVNTGRLDKDGNPVIKVQKLSTNSATLRRDEWVRFDRVLLETRRQRLEAYADLRGANTYSFNGFGSLILETELVDDVGQAHVDFDGLSEGTGAQPGFISDGLPLPITHAPFSFSSRQIEVSRNTGQPLSTVQASMATRRVMEAVEQMTIGNYTPSAYTPSNSSVYRRAPRVYGYTNHPDRNTATVTAPTATGWTPADLVDEINGVIEDMLDIGFNGPFNVYYDKKWTSYLNADYSAAKGDNTLRQRIEEIEEVSALKRLSFLNSDYAILVVQMTEDVARAINGMEFSMIQWDTKGGMQKNFKVMGIQVPHVRSDASGNCGVTHMTTA